MRGVSKIGQAKGMFVYDLVADFSATKPCGEEEDKLCTQIRYAGLFGINRTHDRPAETFVYVVFHSMRIMYVCL